MFALSTLQSNLGGVCVDGYVSQMQAEMINEQVKVLLQEIRPDAVALVDAFDFDDILELHQTAIGRKDGKPYKYLWEWSEKDPSNNSPLNTKTGDFPPDFKDGWKPVLDYFLRSKL